MNNRLINSRPDTRLPEADRQTRMEFKAAVLTEACNYLNETEKATYLGVDVLMQHFPHWLAQRQAQLEKGKEP